MSNDLISRSAVLDIIKKHECDTSRMMSGVIELPTAYDVDKVVERLEKLQTKMVATDTGSVPVFNANTKSFEGFVKQYEIENEFVDKDKAIKIVRAGMDETKGNKEA